jgi:uncharacterized protein (TIGR03437 family)
MPDDQLARFLCASLLQRGAAISAPPEEISVASTQPAIFTKDGSGSGQGLIYKVTDTGEQLLADASNPLAAGDRVLLQCAGLGAQLPTVSPVSFPLPSPSLGSRLRLHEAARVKQKEIFAAW